MKKIFSLLTAILLFSTTFIARASFTVSGDTCNLYYDFNLYDSAQVYVAYTPGIFYTGSIYVPDSVTCTIMDLTGMPIGEKTCAVTEIGAHAFEGMPITSIRLPQTLQFIGDSAFFSCGDLEAITFPQSLNEIGAGAFLFCTSIEKVVIPENVYYIDKNAFGGDNVTTAFQLSSLQSILFESNAVVDINDETFSYVDSTKVILFVKTAVLDDVKKMDEYVLHFKAIYTYDEGKVNLIEDTDSSVKITWAKVEDATKYTLTIKQGETTFREYTINDSGEVVSFHMPATIEMKMDTTKSTTDLCIISISGLSANVNYDYEIVGEDKTQNVVYHKSGSFIISPEGSINHTPNENNSQTGTEDLIKDINIHVEGNTVSITNLESKQATIYSINGRLIRQADSSTIIHLPAGSYIIAVGNKTCKINIL